MCHPIVNAAQARIEITRLFRMRDSLDKVADGLKDAIKRGDQYAQNLLNLIMLERNDVNQSREFVAALLKTLDK